MIGPLDILLSSEDIAARIKTLGEEISSHYQGKPIILICVLKGSFVFAADLVREIDGPIQIEFMRLSSYGNSTTSSGEINMILDLNIDITDKEVLIVEDIVDTGITLFFLRDHIEKKGPAAVKICSLLHKPARQKVEVPIDFLGFTIEDKFVVGYGLDHDERYRNLPFIGVVPT